MDSFSLVSADRYNQDKVYRCFGRPLNRFFVEQREEGFLQIFDDDDWPVEQAAVHLPRNVIFVLGDDEAANKMVRDWFLKFVPAAGFFSSCIKFQTGDEYVAVK